MLIIGRKPYPATYLKDGDAISMRPKPMRAYAEDTELNMNDKIEVQRWCSELDVSEERLRNAVMNAGTKLGDVEKELAKQSVADGDITPSEDIPADQSHDVRVTSDGARSA
jgi:hypothetical protein